MLALRSSRFLIALAIAACAGLLVFILVASGGSDARTRADAAAGFKPNQIKGKWTGTWKNTTFNSNGSILANVKVKDGKLIPIVDFGGTVFGCPDPPAEKVVLKKGNGANRWNSSGFKVDTTTDALGDTKITYKASTDKFTGSGGPPDCNPDVTWEVDGKLTSTKFNADVDIFFPSGPPAEAKLNAKKQ